MRDAFASFMLILLIIFLTVCAVGGIGWVAEGNQFLMFRFFAPRTEQVRREVFEQSKAYNQGMIQQLQQMQFQYEQADDAHKQALADLILHDTADFDLDRLPPNLYQFVEKLRHGNH